MASKSDLSQLAEHLRTVHFALLLACLFTLMPTITGRLGEVGNAWEQLNRIIAIKSDWNRWTQRFTFEQLNWIQMQGIYQFKGEPERVYISSLELDKAGIAHTKDEGWQLQLIGAPVYIFLDVKGAKGWTERLVLARPHGKLDASNTFPADISFSSENVGSRPFETLLEFRNFWDAAPRPRVSFIIEVSPTSYLLTEDGGMAELWTTTQGKPGGGGELIARQLGGCHYKGVDKFFETVYSEKSFNELFCQKITEGTFILPAKIKDPLLPVNLQQWLVKQFNIDAIGGEFAEAFPELNRVTRDYQELDIGKVSRILGAEHERAGERMEFLGIHLPEAMIATWGMVILFAVQAYFWLHLREFWRELSASSTDAGPSVGWIGVYRDHWARLVSFVTIGILPSFVAIVAAWGSRWPHCSIIVAILVVSIAVHSALLVCRVSYRY